MAPSAEDFQRWQDDPVTRWVLNAHRAIAEQNKAEWLRVSWGEGIANPAYLQELRVRADAYEAIGATAYEGYLEANGEEPRDQ